MPFSIPDKLGTSPTPGFWWQEYLDALRPDLSRSAASAITATFGDPPDFTAIADLIITHEATHLFHQIDPVTWASEFPSDWVMELFANLGMHGYLATHEPEKLGLLAVMAEATVDAGNGIWGMQHLSLMGQSMQASVTNYVWYEFRLIRLAEQLWVAGGEDSLRDYQRLLGHPDLPNDQVIERLSTLEPAVADAIRRWPDPLTIRRGGQPTQRRTSDTRQPRWSGDVQGREVDIARSVGPDRPPSPAHGASSPSGRLLFEDGLQPGEVRLVLPADETSHQRLEKPENATQVDLIGDSDLGATGPSLKGADVVGPKRSRHGPVGEPRSGSGSVASTTIPTGRPRNLPPARIRVPTPNGPSVSCTASATSPRQSGMDPTAMTLANTSSTAGGCSRAPRPSSPKPSQRPGPRQAQMFTKRPPPRAARTREKALAVQTLPSTAVRHIAAKDCQAPLSATPRRCTSPWRPLARLNSPSVTEAGLAHARGWIDRQSVGLGCQ